MNLKARLGRIEQTALARGCPICAERDKRMAEAEGSDLAWLDLYLAKCCLCGSQKTFKDLSDQALEAITTAPNEFGIDLKQLTDEELDSLIEELSASLNE